MNPNDVNRAFTEKVAELLGRGYQIHPGTMGGSQGEIAHVDLYGAMKSSACCSTTAPATAKSPMASGSSLAGIPTASA